MHAMLSLLLIALLMVGVNGRFPSIEGYVQQMMEFNNNSLKGAQSYVAAPNVVTIATRSLGGATIGTMLVDGNVEDVMLYLQILFGNQNLNTSSPTFGYIPIMVGPNPDHVTDSNSIAFTMFPVSSMFALFKDSFEIQYISKILPNIRATYSALRYHSISVPIAYTNMCLMNAITSIQLGETFGDSDIAQFGYARLTSWFEYTQNYSIGEFASPTYYAVDLDCLMMGYMTIKNSTIHELLQKALDFFVLDISVSYFQPVSTIVGAQSRDYGFLYSEGSVNAYLYLFGISPSFFEVSGSDIDNVVPVLIQAGRSNSSYFPDSWLTSWATLFPREMQAFTGPVAGQDRHLYVTPQWAVGSASRDYGPQDKLIDIRLDSGSSNIIYPDIFVAVDDTDSPYGVVTARDGDGYLKPSHLPSHPVVIQQEGIIVATFVAENVNRSAMSLATNIVLPLHAENYSINGVPISMGEFKTPHNVTMEVGDSLAVQGPSSSSIIHLLYTEGCGGHSPQVVFQSDKTGIPHNASRLTIYHFKGSPVNVSCQSKSIFALVTGDSNSESQFLQLLEIARNSSVVENSRNSNSAWNVTVEINSATYSIQRVVDRSDNPGGVISRKVNGDEIAFGVYLVNGVDLGKKVLGQ